MTISTLFDLGGKTALVTGCRRGIGRAMALALAEAGADIVGVSSGLEPDGGAVGADVAATGRRFTAERCDLGDRAALDALVERLDVGPPIDILVNNAGIICRAPAAEHADADWDAVLDVNLTAPFRLARALGSRMIARGQGGKIVFTASVLSFQGGILVPGYAASKGAIAQLTKALANEWAGHGVNVNAIAPGYIATDNTAALQADAARTAALLARVPAGRWGVPRDLAGVTVFLCSQAADFVHGAVIPVDGGWLAR
ncbi:SDR family NAD(P)-dependent oxidoreductase [Salinarimonas rosea]|uniref:SDR family NAD(P)-dependent oxidoreductase n=1 Tax=Salinarimonas rosea TaxID=552063 RepID=UPI00040C67BB|nr:SDR family NAD(P)-dependent oxidoreductase [Salinarimonas rosea]